MPSKAIADQYIQHSVTTTAEVTMSGLLVAETPDDDHAPRRQRQGHHHRQEGHRRARAQAEDRRSCREDIVAALTEDELIDLVAYLETLKVAALTPDSFHIVGPFPAKEHGRRDGQELRAGEGRVQPGRGVRDRRDGASFHWKTIRPDGKGYFDLAALHGNAANNSASYMYVEIESPVRAGRGSAARP